MIETLAEWSDLLVAVGSVVGLGAAYAAVEIVRIVVGGVRRWISQKLA